MFSELFCLRGLIYELEIRYTHPVQYIPRNMHTVFALLCFVVVIHWLIFPISIRLTSLALWQSNDCPSASKATLMNMDKYLMWIHYERFHNHNKAKHHKTVCIFLGIYFRWHEASSLSFITIRSLPLVSSPGFFAKCLEVSTWKLVYTLSRLHNISSSCFTKIETSLWPTFYPTHNYLT